MNKRGRKPGKTPPIIFVIIGAAAIIIIVLALGFGEGTGPTAPQGARTSPFIAHEHTVTALEQNDPTVLYEEFSPSMKGLIPLENFISAEDELVRSLGEVIRLKKSNR